MDTEKNTKKVKKGKVIAVVIILIIIIAVVAVLIVKNVNKNKEEGNNTVQGEEELERTIELPDTTYSEMPVKDVNMELMEDINKTVVSS